MSRKKRKQSIVWSITIWYVLSMAIIFSIIVFMVFRFTFFILNSNSKQILIKLVQSSVNEIMLEDGAVELQGNVDYLRNGVYLAIYDRDKELVIGLLPKDIDEDLEIDTTEVRVVNGVDISWYVYDYSITYPGYGSITVRGAMTTRVPWYSNAFFLAVFFLLPGLILLAVIGGYTLAKSSLKPIYQIIDTVEQINTGKDLTKRLNITGPENEIYRLANGFDQMCERLEDSFEREKQFTLDVSHELRTPLSVMMTQCEYALEQENSENTRQALEVIVRQNSKMRKMISQLLMLTRGERAEEYLEVETVHMDELFEVVAEELQEKASDRDIRIVTNIQEDVTMQGDKTLLVRLLVNLVTNAVKYSNHGGVIILSLYKENDKIIGSVQDFGIGIEKENQEKVWERFYQVDPSRTSKDDSDMGLGLAMAKWIATIHKGRIWLESEPGNGSTFTFEFPEQLH